MGKTIDIGGRIHNPEVGNVVTGANEILDDTKNKKQDVINSEVDSALEALNANKQDNLTFDQTPTESSTNPVTSGGVYAADVLLQQAIEAILVLIPSAASALNQLADKAFVNSTVATNTATFRGTYNVVTELGLAYNASHQDIATALLSHIATADNNDYAFVQIPVSGTSEDIRVTERYKFNGTVWGYEYDLNNSGFTATQWEAINSGITALLVTKLGALPTAAELATSLAGKQNVLTFDNVPVSGSDNPVKSGGLYQLFTAIDAKFPSDASANNKLVAENRLAAYVSAIIEALDASFDLTSADGHVTFRMTQTNGIIASVQILTSDIASASQVSTNTADIAALQALYNALQQSAPQIIEPTDTWPVANPSTTVIYRVIDRVNTPPQYYSDYMYNGTNMVLMATYNNAIDAIPTDGSHNLVESGGVYDFVSKVVNVNELILDQGFVASDGSDGENANRPYFVRTKYLKVRDTVFFSDSGIIIRGYAEYNSDGTFIRFVTVNSDRCAISNSIVRLSIRMAADGVMITPEDIMLDTFLAEVKNDAVINLSRFKFQQGYINTIDGDEMDSDIFIRTSGYINVKGKTTFLCGEDFIIRGYAVFVNGVYDHYVSVQLHTCEVENCICRFVVRNLVENTTIKPSDFMLDSDCLAENILNLNTLCYSQGHINTGDGDDDNASSNYIKTDFVNIGETSYLYCDKDFIIRGYAKYDQYHKFLGYEYVNGKSMQLSKGIYRIVVRKYTDDTPIIPSEFMMDTALDNTDSLSILPIAHYNYDTTLLDMTSELNGIDMDAVDSLGCYTFQDQIYAKFDALVSAYPELVEKIDLGVYAGLSYPSYANLNGSPSGDYLATPTYKTYMYKIAYKTTIANVGKTANKRKIFVVAGLHGWENASQLNTYIVASMICKAANEDWYQLASMYDIYFVPCLNGYGAYHDERVNANGVDLNRNFPASNWTESGSGTENYTGPSAASEFETKLIIEAVKSLKPDIFIDHHSYGAPVVYNFYAEPPSQEERNMCYTNLYAWTHRAYKDYSDYFGTSYDVHPQGFASISQQTANTWAKNVGVAISSVVEVCLGISYLNGQIATQSQAKATYYQPPIVRLNELMLRLFLLRYSEYELKNGIRTNKFDPSLLV